jgi:CHAD domain-containing protein
MTGGFQEQKLSKSAMAQVDKKLARESHQLRVEKIHKIRSAMKVQVYRAEQFTTTKGRQFQMRLNSAREVANRWLDADHQSAII